MITFERDEDAKTLEELEIINTRKSSNAQMRIPFHP